MLQKFLSRVALIGMFSLASLHTAVACLDDGDDGSDAVTGEMMIVQADDFEHGRSEVMHFVKDVRDGKMVRLRFRHGAPSHLRSGAIVRARGRADARECC